MKIKITSLVDRQITLKSTKGESKTIEPKKIVTMDEVQFQFFKRQSDVFENSGAIKVEETKKGKSNQKPVDPPVDPPVEPPVETVTDVTTDDVKPEAKKKATSKKKASKKTAKKAQGRSKKRTRKVK